MSRTSNTEQRREQVNLRGDDPRGGPGGLRAGVHPGDRARGRARAGARPLPLPPQTSTCSSPRRRCWSRATSRGWRAGWARGRTDPGACGPSSTATSPAARRRTPTPSRAGSPSPPRPCATRRSARGTTGPSARWCRRSKRPPANAHRAGARRGRGPGRRDGDLRRNPRVLRAARGVAGAHPRGSAAPAVHRLAVALLAKPAEETAAATRRKRP